MPSIKPASLSLISKAASGSSSRSAAACRYASASTSQPVVPLSPAQPSSVKSLLEDTRRLLVEVAPIATSSSSFADKVLEKENKAWSDRIGRLISRIEEGEHGVEIAFFAPPLAGSEDLIASLLIDPFTSSQTQKNVLFNRRNGSTGDVGNTLEIRYGNETAVDAQGLVIPSQWLGELSNVKKCSLFEIPSQTSPSKALNTLLLSQIPVIVIDNLRLLSPSATLTSPSLLNHPNLQIIVTQLSAIPATETIERLTDQLKNAGIHQMERFSDKVHFVNPKKAVDAIQFLTTSQKALEAEESKDVASGGGKKTMVFKRAKIIDEFQKEYLESGLLSFKQHFSKSITNIVSSPSTISTSSASPLGLYLSTLALDSTAFVLATQRSLISETIFAAQSQQSDLRNIISSAKKELLSVPVKTGEVVVSETKEGRLVSKAIVKEARENGEGVLKGMSWKKVLFGGGVDDLGFELKSSLVQGWGGEGERRLIYATGKLQILQKELNESATSSVTAPKCPPLLKSSILLNSLPTPLDLTPETFSTIVAKRLRQLIDKGGPVELLHRRTQSAVVQSYILTALSVGGSYWTWIDSLLSSPSTSISLALFGTLAGIRFGQTKYYKAQTKFWKDYERVADSLEHDLEVKFAEVVTNQVVLKSAKANEGLIVLAKEKEDGLVKKIEECEELRRRIKEMVGETVTEPSETHSGSHPEKPVAPTQATA